MGLNTDLVAVEDTRRIIRVAGNEGTRNGGEGHSAMPAGDAADIPSADDLIKPKGRIAAKGATATEGQTVRKIGRDVVGDVKV